MDEFVSFVYKNYIFKTQFLSKQLFHFVNR